jgi:HSP20 family protein
MATLARFRPFEDALDDFFRGFLVRPARTEGATPFRVDVSESDSEYVLRAELPGVRKDDIAVSIDGDTVAVTAEVRKGKEVKDGERTLRSERYHGRLHRAFALEQPVDEAAAQAKYADGVLELTLPKKAAQAKRITIQ